MHVSPARRVIGRRALIAVSAAALVLPFAATNATAAPSGGRTSLSGSLPGWLKNAKSVGSPSAAAKVSFNVVLPLRNAAAAAKLATDVSNPKSASYGHYVTAAQFNAAYAPTASQVAKVKAFLTGAGIKVSGVAAGNRWVSATGTVKQVESAFATSLHNYSYKGHTIRSNSSVMSVPSSVGVVAGVVGVSGEGALLRPANSGKPVNDSAGTPSDAQPPAAACSAYWDQNEQTMPLAYGKTSFPTPGCGYLPSDLRKAYGIDSTVSSGTNGAGVTVAIIDAYASPTMLQDSNDYSDFAGEPELAPGQYTETVMGPFTLQDECGGEAGWNTEESLDVESVHGMAPGANIHYVGAANCDTGIDDAANYVVQNHLASIVSNSYSFLGEDDLGDEVATEHSIWVQAAAEGIGFYYATGDNADNVELAGLSHPEPDFPGTDPLVTAVGGTTLAVNQSGSYKFETSWGPKLDRVNFATSPSSYVLPLPGDMVVDAGGTPLSDGGGGGGVSALFAQPWYQALLVPKSLAKLNGGKAMRVVPDISAEADPETGFLIDYAGGLYQYGGTSLSTPLIAGIQAVASQHRTFPIGFANPLLYTLGLTGSLAFHDVKPPASPIGMASQSGKTLFTLGLDSSLDLRKGYDDATGLGSPNGVGFLLGERILP